MSHAISHLSHLSYDIFCNTLSPATLPDNSAHHFSLVKRGESRVDDDGDDDGGADADERQWATLLDGKTPPMMPQSSSIVPRAYGKDRDGAMASSLPPRKYGGNNGLDSGHGCGNPLLARSAADHHHHPVIPHSPSWSSLASASAAPSSSTDRAAPSTPRREQW